MKQTISLSIDQHIIRKIRNIAVKKRTSVSQLVNAELGKIAHDSEEYETAKRKAFAYLKKGFHMGGQIRVSRDELHESETAKIRCCVTGI